MLTPGVLKEVAEDVRQMQAQHKNARVVEGSRRCMTAYSCRACRGRIKHWSEPEAFFRHAMLKVTPYM